MRRNPAFGSEFAAHWADPYCNRGPNRNALFYEFGGDFDDTECLLVRDVAAIQQSL